MNKTDKYYCTIGRSDYVQAETCIGSIVIQSDSSAVYLKPEDSERFAAELSDLTENLALSGRESDDAVRQELALTKKCLSAIREAIGDDKLSDSELPEAVRKLMGAGASGWAYKLLCETSIELAMPGSPDLADTPEVARETVARMRDAEDKVQSARVRKENVARVQECLLVKLESACRTVALLGEDQ